MDREYKLDTEEILDKHKMDAGHIAPELLFYKSMGDWNLSWMAIQTIARSIRHLAISQLQMGVLSFAVFAIIIYGFNWNKPKGVNSPITILEYDGEIPKETIDIIGQQPIGSESILIRLMWLEEKKTALRGSNITNDYVYTPTGVIDEDWQFWSIITGTALFGGIHLAAWNFEFPTYIELILWRCSSMICTLIFITVLIISLGIFYVFGLDETPDWLQAIY